MLTPISRRSIFHASPFADQFIAEMQQSYASDLDPNDRQDAAELKRLFDHRQPIHEKNDLIEGHCVIAYDTNMLRDYMLSLPLVVKQFLQALNIRQLYLMDFVKTNLYDFPFENFSKRNRFKRLGAINNKKLGYVLQTEDLPKVLPLFYFARKWDVPVIFLVTAEGEVPLSMRLCDDGNFHLNYEAIYEDRILKAAQKTGLVTGDIELCSQYSISYLDNE